MKVLTPEQMREADRRTIEAGIPGIVLMENAASRVVEFLESRFAPLSGQRIVVVCGKGNNGGDGLAIARQLLIRHRPAALDVFLAAKPEDLSGDAAANYRMFLAAGGELAKSLEVRMGAATLVIDALLGTGLNGPAAGAPLDWIRRINSSFPAAKVIAVDVPSGLIEGSTDFVRADCTVTFSAPKAHMVLPPLAEHTGELIVGRIGTTDALLGETKLHLSELSDFSALLRPRPRDSHKGTFGHVLVVGGSEGKTGAARMAGLAALRAGAGLVTVASSAGQLDTPELMTAPLGEELPLERKSVVALGPGLGFDMPGVLLSRKLAQECPVPLVIDADGLNALAGATHAFWGEKAAPRILTPHPGEMQRLAPGGTDRVESARALATSWHCTVVLKGNRTLIAFPDGNVWINPTGSPALAKGGSGDILTGLIAGFVAQFPADWQTAVRAAVYLHGRAAELAAATRGEKGVLATDLLDHLFEGLHAL